MTKQERAIAIQAINDLAHEILKDKSLTIQQQAKIGMDVIYCTGKIDGMFESGEEKQKEGNKE